MFNKVLNKIESKRNSNQIIWNILIFLKNVFWEIYIIILMVLKIPVFLYKKTDWNCDSFSLMKQILFYSLGYFKLPSEPVVLKSTEYGFFSNVMRVIGYYHFCEINEYAPYIEFDSGCYLDKKRVCNWYEYYFTLIHNNNIKKIKNTSICNDNSFAFYSMNFLTLTQKHQIVNKYMKIHSNILEEVDDFIQKNFNNHYVVGVHIRGTDKYTETQFRYSTKRFFDTVDKKINNNDSYKIFLATDDNNYFTEFKSKYGDRLISQDLVRSDSGPVHYNPKNKGYEIGKQVLMDALILSKCDYFIGCRSNVSHFVLIFNSDINFKIIKKM